MIHSRPPLIYINIISVSCSEFQKTMQDPVHLLHCNFDVFFYIWRFLSNKLILKLMRFYKLSLIHAIAGNKTFTQKKKQQQQQQQQQQRKKERKKEKHLHFPVTVCPFWTGTTTQRKSQRKTAAWCWQEKAWPCRLHIARPFCHAIQHCVAGFSSQLMRPSPWKVHTISPPPCCKTQGPCTT